MSTPERPPRPPEPPAAPRGVATFAALWFSQALSIFGSALVAFGLGVFTYQETGSVTKFAFVILFSVLPRVLLSPIAGSIADRRDRRWVLIGSDVVTALPLFFLLALLGAGRLEVWHIYVATAVSSAGGAFQWPALHAVTPLLVPKAHLARAAGLVQAVLALSQVLAPLAAGALLPRIELTGLIYIDLVSLVLAVVILLVIRIPRPPVSRAGAAAAGPPSKDFAFSWAYLRERPGLFGLLGLLAGVHLVFGGVQVLVTPLLLTYTSVPMLGRLMAFAAVGSILGGVTLGIWGGPKRRVYGVVLFIALMAVSLIVGGLRPNIFLIAAANAVMLFCLPIIGGCLGAIWQTKIPPDLLGRMFALRTVVTSVMLVIGQVVTGPLVERIFEPLLAEGGALAGSVGQLIGTGPGRGIGVMWIVMGSALLLLLAVGWSSRRLRDVEAEIPDAIGDRPPGAPPGQPAG